MTIEQKIKDIRKACLEANLDLLKPQEEMNHFLSKINYQKSFFDARAIQFMNECLGRFRPIRLADVLLAIGRRQDCIHVSTDGWFCVLQSPMMEFVRRAEWNLRKDDLTLQDEPTINFIHDFVK